MMNILLAVTIGKTEDIEPKSKVRHAKRRTNEITIATELIFMDLYQKILKKLHFGKPILRDGAKNHKVNKIACMISTLCLSHHIVSNLSDDHQSRWYIELDKLSTKAYWIQFVLFYETPRSNR